MTPREALLRCGAGDAGSVSWQAVARRLDGEARARCEGAAPQVNSLHAALFPYYAPPQEGGNLCLYARGEDYHRVLARRLAQAAGELEIAFPGRRFLPFADASPFPEVLTAALCGLGVVGENGLLISPRWGSYVFVGLLASDLPWAGEGTEIRRCLQCMACRRACPGGALGEDGFAPGRCLSHITQLRGERTERQDALVRRHPLVWGCDTCQTVCPLNRGAEETPLPEFRENLLHRLPPEDGGLSDRQFRKKYRGRAFCWRGVAPLRRNIDLQREKQE